MDLTVKRVDCGEMWGLGYPKSRSQGLNRFYARRQLCELLEDAQLGKASPEAKRIEKIRKQKDRRKRRQK